MQKTSHILIGKIAAVHGVKGEVIVTHSLGKKTNFKNVKALMIEQLKNSLIPYFIQSAKATLSDESIVAFEDVPTREAAKILVGKSVWLLEEDFRALAAKQSTIRLIGYELWNEAVLIGKIESVLEQPHQVLLTVLYKGQEALIPFVDEMIVSIQHDEQKLVMSLPDGLLEIYE